MPVNKTGARLKETAKDIAESLTDRVEDTFQGQRERYIKYKASAKTTFFWARFTRLWSKNASRITRTIVIALGIFGSAAVAVLIVKYFIRRKAVKKMIKRKNKNLEKDLKSAKMRLSRRTYRNAKVLKILENSTAAELVALMKASEVSVQDVLQYFMRKGIEIHGQYNHIVQLISEAETRAKELDAMTEKNGILFGLPVDISDYVTMKDYDSMSALAKRIDIASEEDCATIKTLLKEGAIPFTRSNIDENTMSYTCSNLVYGATAHPQSSDHVCGGSCGGSAVAVATGAAPLSIGYDTCGDVRHPAHCCGVVAFKPTSLRVSRRGLPDFEFSSQIVQGTVSPIGRSVEDVVLATQALMLRHHTDPLLPSLPYNVQMYTDRRPLCIGMYIYDGCTEVTPSCTRAVEEARLALEAQSHKVVMWKPFGVLSAFMRGVLFSAMSTHSTNNYLQAQRSWSLAARLPRILLAGLAILWTKVNSWQADILQVLSMLRSLDHFQGNTTFMKKFQQRVVADWSEHHLDALICPAFATPALTHEHSHHAIVSSAYLSIYNALDFPSGVVPVVNVNKEDISDSQHYPTYTEQHPLSFYTAARQSIESSLGLPVAVQCVAPPYRDEVCLRVMLDIQTHIHGQ